MLVHREACQNARPPLPLLAAAAHARAAGRARRSAGRAAAQRAGRSTRTRRPRTRTRRRSRSVTRSGFFGRVTVGLGPGMKPMDEIFNPGFKGDTSSLGVVEVPLPMGMIFEESEAAPGKFEVVEVVPGSNAEAAGVQPGDLLRATTAMAVNWKASMEEADTGFIEADAFGGKPGLQRALQRGRPDVRLAADRAPRATAPTRTARASRRSSSSGEAAEGREQLRSARARARRGVSGAAARRRTPRNAGRF